MSRLTGYVVSAALLVGAAAVAGVLIARRPEPAPRELAARVPVALTDVVVAGSGPIVVQATGTVRPSAQIDVAAAVSGQVVWVDPAFQTGGRVSRDQVLFRLDDADHRHRVERARAGVTVQRVELLKVEEAARVARDQFDRFRRTDAGASADAGPLALWEPQIEAARAALDRERAALAEAELGLARTEVRAPIAGVVRSESVEAGQFVAAGRTVGQLHALDAVEVVVQIPDADAALIPDLWDLRPGVADRRVPTRVIADYGGGRHAWPGYVDRVEPARDERTRNLDAIVRVPDPLSGGAAVEAAGAVGVGGETASRPPLMVGQFVDVEIRGVTPDPYFRVPRAALRPGSEVWAVRGDALTIVPVRVLQRAGDDVYVTGALTAGQPVVVGGIEIATEGMAVRTAVANVR